jgi:outer membrane protein Pom
MAAARLLLVLSAALFCGRLPDVSLAFRLDCGRMLRLLVLALLVPVTAARAQDSIALQEGWEFGVRYWFSTGTTRWSHNAQGIDPSLGNPTSTLTYEDVRAHSLELHARNSYPDRWFVRGYAGIGKVTDGRLIDEDFFAGQVKFSESHSTVKGDRLKYAMLDIGRDIWVGRSNTLGLFAGYHYWTERVDAFGATFPVNFLGNPDLPESELVISNEVTWNSLRLGVSWNAAFGRSTRFSLDAAFLPYARFRNEDSHYLRSDFGPAPNVFMNANGYGAQLDLELRQRFAGDWEAGAGLRYWWIRAVNGDVSTRTFSAPLVEFISERVGLTLTLAKRW